MKKMALVTIGVLGIYNEAKAQPLSSFPGPHEKALEQELAQFRGPNREQLAEAYAQKRCSTKKPTSDDIYNWEEDPLAVCDFFKESQGPSAFPQEENQKATVQKPNPLNRSRPQTLSDPQKVNKSLPG